MQPQSDIPHFRRFIQSEGWEITEEKMVEEDGKFYPMMRVVPGKNVHSSLKLNVDSFPKGKLLLLRTYMLMNGQNAGKSSCLHLESKYLLQEKNQVLYHYLQEILPDSGPIGNAPKAEAVTARILEVKEEAQLIAAALAEYEG